VKTMSAKFTVAELARMMGKPPKEVLFLLQGIGVDVKSVESVLDPGTAQAILTGKTQAPKTLIVRQTPLPTPPAEGAVGTPKPKAERAALKRIKIVDKGPEGEAGSMPDAEAPAVEAVASWVPPTAPSEPVAARVAAEPAPTAPAVEPAPVASAAPIVEAAPVAVAAPVVKHRSPKPAAPEPAAPVVLVSPAAPAAPESPAVAEPTAPAAIVAPAAPVTAAAAEAQWDDIEARLREPMIPRPRRA